MKKIGLALVIVIGLAILLSGSTGINFGIDGDDKLAPKGGFQTEVNYANTEAKEITMQFKSNGAFEVYNNGKVFEKGTYVVKGNIIKVKNEDAAVEIEMTIEGSKIIDPGGAVWQKVE